ncbi:hypothetical protein B4098_3359 [Heyndrickxia coagulans]|uniref:Uncharacterized protein n=1 Tax=Heyndrickxia coagulans TaxID=1398 RepID=A0A150K882_HEYCO|nr:hypothetical protein B4098_3359 [Heyndrickxia coagulans]
MIQHPFFEKLPSKLKKRRSPAKIIPHKRSLLCHFIMFLDKESQKLHGGAYSFC